MWVPVAVWQCYAANCYTRMLLCRNMASFSPCDERQFRPAANGRLTSDIFLSPTDAVSARHFNGKSPELTLCVWWSILRASLDDCYGLFNHRHRTKKRQIVIFDLFQKVTTVKWCFGVRYTGSSDISRLKCIEIDWLHAASSQIAQKEVLLLPVPLCSWFP